MLYLATRYKNELARLTKELNWNWNPRSTGKTALHIAAGNRNTVIAKVMLDNRADANATIQGKRGDLDTRTVMFLLENGIRECARLPGLVGTPLRSDVLQREFCSRVGRISMMACRPFIWQ